MRHIQMEIAHLCKESPTELPAQEGALPGGEPGPGVGETAELEAGPPRPFGEEEIKLQKVYQLSILSQHRGVVDPHEGHRVLRSGVKRAPEEPPPTHKRPHLAGPGDDMDSEVLCGPGPPFSSAGTNDPRSPSPQDPTALAALPKPESSSVGGGQGLSPGQGGKVDGSNGSADPEVPAELSIYHPLGSPPMVHLGPEEARTWMYSLESSPPEQTAVPATSSNGLPSSEKTPTGPTGLCPGPAGSPAPFCPAKKRLLSPSDTGESCSEDEGPSTSKRSRLALLAPGLGLGACRSTDAKGAPFWNHLLPATHNRPKGSADGMRVGRRLNCASRLKSRQLRSGRRSEPYRSGRSSWPSASISHSLLGNFEESILKGRFSPSGQIEGFTAEIGASGSYCPKHATLPVQVTYYDISEHSAPSPFLGVIFLEALGKKGYSVPKSGTIQVTLFNPNKTVVKMFLVTYNFGDMPVNHMTFLRHRIFLVPVEEGEGKGEGPEGVATDRKKILCYLIHLRFQSSKSGKLYLHDDIRLLFSRKSIEVDTGIPYELKSYTEVPKNPMYSPRV
ncbi:hypothetical protein GJAV_G00027870 [Gymnothorax javanicus]|nr:hypothetical protein GJAV_G00027870 [Gymnothorax javanicus]